MSCQRYKPAEFKFHTPRGLEKDLLQKGVPQVDPSILKVSETFHAPPAYSLSHDVFVSYPPDPAPVPARQSLRSKFHGPGESADVKPHNFVSPYQELGDVDSRHQKAPAESKRHPGQRALG